MPFFQMVFSGLLISGLICIVILPLLSDVFEQRRFRKELDAQAKEREDHQRQWR